MKEFQVGDNVYCLRHGNGVVTGVVTDIDEVLGWPFILVEFNEYGDCYTLDGKLYKEDVNRMLYHGHDLEVIVKEKEKEPKRRWINVYYDTKNNCIYNSLFYNSKEEGIKNKSKDDKFMKYLCTVEIPGGFYEDVV